MLTHNDFALEQLETRTELLFSCHVHWTKVCLVRIPFLGCIAYVWRPYWHCHF